MQSNSFDLIFIDCLMPVLNGYETTIKLRELDVKAAQSDDHIPIVALTANAMPEDKQKCLDVGMDDYLAKPIVFNELCRVLSLYERKKAER